MSDKDDIETLWQEYLEAATASGSTENGAIDLYDIDGMNEAAYALYQAAKALKGPANDRHTPRH
jgi:hypothetical protein